MADELLGVLGPTDFAAFQNSVTQNDPYGIMGRSLASWQPNTATWSPETTAATAFGKAFLSGLLGNYARQNAADQLNSVASVLPQLRSNPLEVAAPEGVNADAFAALRGNAILKKYEADAQKERSLAEMMQQVGIAGLKKKAEVLGENQAFEQMGQGGAVNPNSPAYKLKQDEVKQANEKFSNERSLANDFMKVSENFRYKDEGLKALTKAYMDTSGTSDYEIIRRGAQMVEPGLSVKLDDQQSLEGAASALGMSVAAVKAALSGETKLSPEVRNGIMRIAQRSYDASLVDYNTLRDTFLERARAANLAENAVVPFGAAKPFAEVYPNLNINTVAPPQGQTIKAPDGKTIILVD